MRSIGPGRWALVVALLALVNLPVVAGLLSDRQIATEGEEVTAQVLDAREQEGAYAVVLRFDERVDPTGRAWPVRVERPTYERARSADELPVRAVVGEPGAYEVPGEVRSSTGLWMTLLGNVLVAAWVWVMVRRAGRRSASADPADPEPPGGDGPGPR